MPACTGIPIAPDRVTRTLDCQRCNAYRLPTREARLPPPADARVVAGRVECENRVPKG